MVNEANAAPSHREMQHLIWRHFANTAIEVKIEYRLPNAKIADVFIREKKRTTIIEIKTIFTQSLLYEAYRKYAWGCDHLYIATGWLHPLDEILKPQPMRWAREDDRVGILLVTWEGITEIRQAGDRP